MTNEGASQLAPKPLASLEVSIPLCEVTTIDEVDHVGIPGGDIVLVEGRPLVPSYTVTVDYPGGCQVQDVTLVHRGDLSTDSSLNLPDAYFRIAGNMASAAQKTAEDSRWWPGRVFGRTTYRNAGETTTLVIHMYPFNYDRTTTNVEFYKSFVFDVDYTVSEVNTT